MVTEGRTGTTTILFTDLVGSTELLQRAGDERAQRIFRTHHDLLKETVASHGGHEVKWLGDGLMVAFDSTAEAVRCAIEMQRASARPIGGERLRIRAGLSVGDALRDEADYFGTPVVIARRLCDSAEGGRILCAAAVPAVLSGRGEFHFQELGALELKGINGTVAACEVLYERTPPGAMLAHPPFVGRSQEVARLEARLKACRHGRGGLVTLAGEPVIGKTRLAEEFCQSAKTEGATVVWGRCYEGEWSPPYGPFVEALDELLQDTSKQGNRQLVTDALGQLGPTGGLIAKLAPGVGDIAPELPEPARMEPEEERFRLMEAVSQFFIALSQSAPLVLVLDDLHWAGPATVGMLRHLARAAAKSPLLLLGTYRDVELDRRHPLSEALGTLPRVTNCERIPLKGLETDEVGQLLETLAEHDVPRALVEAIGTETDGNPLFIREVLLHLTEEGKIFQQDGRWTSELAIADMGIPEGVRQVIGRRLSRLSDEGNRALSHGSVLGRHFDFDVLQALTELEDEELLPALEEALSAQLIEEAKGQYGPSYRFTHALVQETLYAELSIARKQRLHLRAGQELERARAGRLEPLTGELARHFREGNDAAKGIEYSLAAGEAARRLFAYEEAAAHWEAALKLLEEAGAEPGSKGRLLEALGDLMFVTGLDHSKAIEFLERALRLYEEMGQEERSAQVHSRLGRQLSGFRGTMDMDRALAHFRAAEPALTRGPERASQAHFYVGLALAAIFALRAEEGIANSRLAIEVAERLKNEALSAIGTAALGCFLSHTGRLKQAMELLEQSWTKADRLNLSMGGFLAAYIQGNGTLWLADPREAQREFKRELEKARLAQAPFQRGSLIDSLGAAHAMAGDLQEARRLLDEVGPMDALGGTYLLDPELALWDGEWGRVEALSAEQREQGRRSGNRLLAWWGCFNLGRVHRLRDEPAEAEARFEEALAISVDGPELTFEMKSRTELALLYSDMGRVDEAHSHVQRCRDIMAEGEDWRGLAGRVALAGGAAAAAERQLEEAERDFNRAFDIFRRYTLPWDEAEALLYWGRALILSREDARASEKLKAAIDIYRRHGAGERWVELVERERATRPSVVSRQGEPDPTE